MKSSVLSGRIWVLLDEKNCLIEDIDTDQIFHNAYLHITELEKMGQYAFDNLEGWKDFARKAEPGDIIVAGRNFGAGSSRQQAVDCFIALQSAAILAPSFGAIYFRNAVNSGFPVISCPDLGSLAAQGKIKSGEKIRIDLQSGECTNLTRQEKIAVEPMSEVQFHIWQAGGLFAYASAQ